MNYNGTITIDKSIVPKGGNVRNNIDTQGLKCHPGSTALLSQGTFESPFVDETYCPFHAAVLPSLDSLNLQMSTRSDLLEYSNSYQHLFGRNQVSNGAHEPCVNQYHVCLFTFNNQ